MFITTSVGEILLLKYILNNLTPSNMVLHLFTNDITPSSGYTLNTYIESTADGYASITLIGSNWTFATIDGVSTAFYTTQTFNYTATEILYGYYLTNMDVGNVPQIIWAERFFDAPATLPNYGGPVDITPTVALHCLNTI